MRPLWIWLMLLPSSPAWGQPVLEYTFDDQADPTANSGSLGAAYDGALVGDAAFVAFGGGFAISLDGDQDVVSPNGDPTGLNVADGDFTLFARFQTANSEPGGIGNRFLFKRESLGSSPSYVLGVHRDTGLVHFALADGVGFAEAVSTFPVNDGATHEVLGARSGDVLRIFIDGSFDAQAPVPGSFGSTAASDALTIGGRLISSDDDFLGVIDEVAIYDVALDEGCGDGIALGAEECDDGNLLDGDGCSAACLLESPCSGGPAGGCIVVSKASLSVKESKPGSEKLKLSLKKPLGAVPAGAFGDPVGGTTRVDACIYDQADVLVEDLTVDRAGELCGPKQKPCWKAGGSSVKYKDPDAGSDGVKKLGAKPAKASLKLQAGNKASKGQTSLPTGIAAGLQAATSVRLQVLTSDAECFEATLGTVQKADGTQFKAKTP